MGHQIPSSRSGKRRSNVHVLRYPDFAPSDALKYLGNDRRLFQGPNETEANFRARLKTPWDQWARAGTWLGLLVQLYWYGLTNAIILQKNGKAATLTGAPVVGQDPTSLYSFTDAGTCPVALTSRVTPPTQTSAGRAIPAGTPFVTFDSNTDFCSQFAVIVPSWPFASVAYATFGNTDSAIATWPVPFADTNYGLIFGPAKGPYVINADGASKTKTQITMRASAPYNGTVPVIAWEAGVNPFNLWSSSSSGVLKEIIRNFRPNARCVGAYAYTTTTGAWAWPIRKWGDGTKWGATAVVQIVGPF